MKKSGLKKKTPPFLKKGDEIGIISPSFIVDEARLNGAVTFLEKAGYRVRTGRNVLSKSGPFAGTDKARLSDLQEMTNDRNIKAIFCSRGGYGLTRIIDKVDFSPLTRYPKWYVGFSDITVLHMWLNRVCGLVSLHAEMPVNYTNPDKSPETVESLVAALSGSYPGCDWKGNSFRPGTANGEITGGNLSLLYSLTGTRAGLQTRGKILFIEDTGENFYHLDRMIRSLRLAGKLDGLAALLVGGLNEMTDGKTAWGKTAEETVAEALSDLDYPVFFGFPAGHISDNRAIYMGKRARILQQGGSFRLEYM